MPYYEYECPEHGRITRFWPSFKEAEPHIDSTMCGELIAGRTETIDNECKARFELLCEETAKRVLSAPLEAMLYGNPEGYHKPSPTKRYSTKLVSAKDGNKNSIG